MAVDPFASRAVQWVAVSVNMVMKGSGFNDECKMHFEDRIGSKVLRSMTQGNDDRSSHKTDCIKGMQREFQAECHAVGEHRRYTYT